MKRLTTSLVGFGMLLSGAVYAAADVEAGRIKGQTCLGCHGVANYNNVYPTYHVPKLAGQHAGYLVTAMKAYKEGLRSHSTMYGNVVDLSEQDMQDIAAYFAQDAQ
ncbi:MAG: cytochrome c [Cycloclasticus sp.]|nr:cytochrome C [Cycloclasticus sp. 46_83_sub15_T18]OUR83134.1 cytochrome C [Cycloclasticus sp. 46_120_T64]